MKDGHRRVLMGSMALMALPGLGNTANPPGVAIPGALRPGQLEKQLKEPPTPKAEPRSLEMVPRQPIPALETGTVAFTLRDVRLNGATVYSAAVLKGFFAELLGKPVTLAQLRTAANNLVAQYRNDGYVLAQALIPQQTLKNGTVQFDIIEGFVADVKLQGDTPQDFLGLIEDYLAKIKAARPARIAVLERYLLLLNDLPGITAHGSLTPSAQQPGAADLIVQISQQNLGAALGFNNRLTKLLGEYRGELYAEGNNLFGLQEKTSARLFQSFEGKMTVLSLGEDLPISGEGTRASVTLNQVWSATSPFDILSGLNSNLVSLNLGISHPLLRGRNSNLSLHGAFNLVDSRSNDDATGATLTNDRLRSFRVGLTYDLADAWRGITLADLELSQGVNALGARDPSEEQRATGEAKLSSADGQVDYTKVTLYLARLQALAPNLAFLAAFSGQYSEDVLLAPEQFALGGEQFLRAYDPSEFIGDKGFATKAELRYTANPFDAASTTFYGFFDYGEVHFNDPRRPRIRAEATGLGVRLSFSDHFSGYIEGAKPLHPDERSGQNKDMRLFGGFRLTY